MSGWIHDPSDAVAPELILHGDQHLGAARNGPVHGLVDILDVNKNHYRRAAVERRRTAGLIRPLGLNHDHGGANRQQCVRWLAIRTRAAAEVEGSKGIGAKLDGCSDVTAH
jgi:hypothetical protein